MRTLEYRQNLDSYKIVSDHLRLVRINILFPGQDPLAQTPTQLERLNQLAKADSFSNSNLGDFNLIVTNEKGIRLSTTLLNQKSTLDLIEVQLKACCVDLGFRLKGDEESDTVYVKVPFGASSGTLQFTTRPHTNKAPDFYTICWQNGILSSISEVIDGNLRLFTNVGHPQGSVNAKLAVFNVQETL